MSARLRYGFGISTAGLITAAAVLSTLWWLVPQENLLRTKIDSDRASVILIQQQRSNLSKLNQEVESIKEKQVAVESHLWNFITEDNFFTLFDTIAKANSVAIDAPSIADVTPNGKVIPRKVTITIRGPLPNALDAVEDLQRHSPILAIQKVSLDKGLKTSDITLAVTAATLWK